MVFTFGSLLVAIQVASGQLTPRIIATALLRNRPIRWAVGSFVFALLLAIAVKTRVDTIPQFLASLMGVFGLLNVLVFMFLIDYAARLLRPISILRRIARQGLVVIEDVYPQLLSEAADGPRASAAWTRRRGPSSIRQFGKHHRDQSAGPAGGGAARRLCHRDPAARW